MKIGRGALVAMILLIAGPSSCEEGPDPRTQQLLKGAGRTCSRGVCG